VIVGGGIMGTSIAIETARRSDPLREPVVLFERAEIGAGSSGASGAILRQHYADRPVAAMARDSLREYASFETRTGRTIGFLRTGVMTLAGPDRPEWIERIKRTVAMLTEIGVRAEVVEAERIRELVPGIRVSQGAVGSWERDAGHVSPKATLAAFASLARSYGAVTRLGVAVEEILVENGRVTGVRTTAGHCAADRVVVCAGPWTRKLLTQLDVSVPLRVVRPENVFVGMPDASPHSESEHESHMAFDVPDDPMERLADELRPTGILSPRGLHPAIIDVETDFYCRCEPAAARTRVGRTDYGHDQVLEDPDALTQEVSDEMKAWARERLIARMPDYAESSDAGTVASWYTLTPDAQPLIGPLPQVEGLFLVAGFSGHGFKLGPSVGQGVAQLLFGEPITAFDEQFFAPTRFRGDEAWGGRFGL
jgi:glycine/D-amino acid oxidase-like deaminating enzyme